MNSDTMRLVHIPLDQIKISEFNVRKNLDAGSEDSNIDDLARSINEKGLLSPIIVLEEKEVYKLITGQRRFLACNQLGWTAIPAFIRNDLKDVDARIVSLIENVHRADLHPLDKGRAYDYLYSEFGTYSRVHKETGVSPSTIKRYMNLLHLAPSIQEFLTTSDGPAGICTLSLLAELFPDLGDQEYVLERIGRFKQQVQMEILKRSAGDISKIDVLVEQALGGCFNVFICKGLKGCPFIPEECLDDVKRIIEQTESSTTLIEQVEESQTEVT